MQNVRVDPASRDNNDISTRYVTIVRACNIYDSLIHTHSTIYGGELPFFTHPSRARCTVYEGSNG